MNNIVLSAQNISKAYRITEHKFERTFWALKDISFDIQKGDRVAITGDNGAGKSTLLKIISRITTPTTGKIIGKGSITSMLEVGAGFHPDLSGLQNIYLNGAMLGMSKSDISAELETIVAFAAISDHLNVPIKKYSSGQYMRLAFSVAVHLKSDILIADEILAVSDQKFRQKCLNKLMELSYTGGRTLLFVSHNRDDTAFLCNKEIKLCNGQMI